MNYYISLNVLNISIPLPWFALAGLISQMFYSQCFIGTLSFLQTPLEISLNLLQKRFIPLSSVASDTKKVVGVVSNVV